MNTIVFKSLLGVLYFLAYVVFALLIIRPDVNSYWYLPFDSSMFFILFPFLMHLLMYLDKDFGMRGNWCIPNTVNMWGSFGAIRVLLWLTGSISIADLLINNSLPSDQLKRVLWNSSLFKPFIFSPFMRGKDLFFLPLSTNRCFFNLF